MRSRNFTAPRTAEPIPMHFECINWKCVADRLEQHAQDFTDQLEKPDVSPYNKATFATCILVVGALADAIREGLE